MRSLALLVLLASWAAAAEPVAVREGSMPVRFTEHPLTHSERPDANGANFPLRGGKRTERTLDLATVELENRFLRLVVVPAAGGPVARAVYKGEGWDLFHVSDRASNGVVAWTSGVKVSFPYKEHGIRLPDQPASWRVVRGEEGDATVAMWMEFSRFTGPWNRRMFGRFSNMLLSQHVRLAPGSAAFDVVYRVTNPAPYRQGRQLWNDALFPRHHTRAGGVIHDRAKVKGRTKTEWIFPAAHVSGHSGSNFRPYDPDLTMAEFGKGASVFGWAMPYGYAGLWYPEVRVNRLRLTDPAVAPGGKQFFTEESRPSASVELWSGTDSIFEQVETWVGPGEVFEVAFRYTLVSGIRKVDFATDHAAVNVELGEAAVVEAVTYTPYERLVLKIDLEPFGEPQPCGPETPARWTLPAGTREVKLLSLVADDQPVLESRFPVTVQHDKAHYELIRRTLDPKRPENAETLGNSESMGRAVHRASYPEGSTGRGRVLYRLGRLDAAVAALLEATAARPGDGEAWHLLGAAFLEKEMYAPARAAFERALAAEEAYPAARYFLALEALRQDAKRRGKEDVAREHLEALIEARPAHWEGRLLLAHREAVTKKDLERARAMAAEDPADPRMQWVLWQGAEAAGEKAEAAAAKAAFEPLAREPGAPRRLEEFKAAIEGRYVPPARMAD